MPTHWRTRLALSTAAIAATTLVASTAASAAVPGDLCTVGPTYQLDVYDAPVPNIVYYTVAIGSSVRIVAYADNGTYYGHGNGKRDGYFDRRLVRQETCHQ